MRAIALVNLISVMLVLVASPQLLTQPLSPTQWHCLRAHHVDIIFKGNMNREAQRMANTLEHLYEPVTRSLGVQPAKIALVLRNQKTIPNAWVTLGPRKAEFCTFPTQDYNFTGTSDWLSLLAVHEFRHVAQYAQLKQNFNQLAYKIGGDLALGTMIVLNVPAWFLEGDAVGIETAFTQSGRGRIPYFSLLYRTNLLARGRFSYAKQVLGSFKNPVPDHYRIGYYLTTHLRRKYGPGVLIDILQRTTWPRPFYYATEKITGKSLLQIHEEANQELETLWKKQLQDLKLTQATRLNTRSHTGYSDYAYPQLDKEGNIIVLKSGIGTVAQFVGLDSKQRARGIFTPGDIAKHVGFSTAQNQIVWVETTPDPRWEDRSYGIIQRYDTQTKRLKTLTHKSRYGSAALSPDATKIVAFESDEAYNHQIVILDAETGQVLRRLPNPDNHFYLTPKWSEDGNQIVVVKSVRQRVTITLINVPTGETQDLLPYSTEHLGCPAMIGQYVFYNSAYSGIDNIYAIDLTTHRRYQVTSRKYGAYNPTISADGRWLVFNDFTKEGMDVAKMPLDPKQWIPLEQVEDKSVHYHAPLVAQEDNSDVLAHLPNRTYPVERYHPWKHWFNVHSWLTLKDVAWNTEDPQKPSDPLQQVELDVLQSKDLLDTTDLKINYLHNFQEKFGKASARISYKGWYPVVSLEGTLGRSYKERINYYRILGIMLELPLQVVRGQYTHELSLSTTGTIHKKDKHACYKQAYKGLVSRNSKKSPRDIYHPWQQKLEIQYRHTPQEGDVQEQYLGAQAEFSFPGLCKHHAFRLGAAYQGHHHTFVYKGYPDAYIRDPRIIYTNYDFPIYYPDWSMGYFFYVKRLRANVFYSFVDGVHPPKEETRFANKVDVGLLADMHIFTLCSIPQLSMGIRYLYSLEQRTGSFRFVFSVAP